MISENSDGAIGPEYGASAHYAGERGEAYFAWQAGGGFFSGRINARKFKDRISDGDVVADFGCGGGFLLSSLDCAERIGIEINPVARSHAQSIGIRVVSAAEELPDSSIDKIVSDHALEHVPYPIEALRQLRLKLKPGGELLLCVPIDNWRRQRRYNPDDIDHHLQTWTPQLLGNTLVEAGYEIVTIRPRILAWPGRFTVVTYGRLPWPIFRAICFAYGWATGKGAEILAVARHRTGGRSI